MVDLVPAPADLHLASPALGPWFTHASDTPPTLPLPGGDLAVAVMLTPNMEWRAPANALRSYAYATATRPALLRGLRAESGAPAFANGAFVELEEDVPAVVEEFYPEGKYSNRSDRDTGLGQFTADDENIVNTDNVVWLTTGTTHVARAEEWPIMPTEWVNVLLKPWNFFDETPTLGLNRRLPPKSGNKAEK